MEYDIPVFFYEGVAIFQSSLKVSTNTVNWDPILTGPIITEPEANNC